ncbi:aldehyde dehydrogenase family protein [Rhodococcus opacus]|nr:aldehyde dehydrogenase family protein [Rhodococcus opacus]
MRSMLSRCGCDRIRAFLHQGQICSGRSRLIVHAPAETNLEAVVRRAKALTHADPLDSATTLGAMVEEKCPAAGTRIR